jgi:benzoyl-CoA reductase/2-hydroxyglutaryl-CoA dehydratase subunit BcrC/BadD/HgdB
MTNSSQDQVDLIPLPDMSVVAEMHSGIATRLSDVQLEKQAGRPVVAASILIPKEIIYAMDVPVIFQEVLASWIAIFRLSGTYCEVAEEKGISRDVCAFHRSSLGCALADERDPFFAGAFVEPDLLLGTNYPCMSGSKSFQILEERFGCPSHMVDAPLNMWGREIPEHAVTFFAEELRRMIEFLEANGFTMDWDELKREVQFTKDLNRVLDEIEVYRRAVPTPIKSFDTFVAAMSPIALPKSMRTLELYERLRDELKERVEKGVGVVEGEKLRLLWVGVPPVCDLPLLNHCEQRGAVIAKNMVEYVVGFPLDPELLDPERPLESIARGMLANPVNPPYQMGIDAIVGMARDYNVDGAISVVKRTCGLVPGMQRLVKEALLEQVGVPSVVLDLDGVDDREYDSVAARANIDSFVETLLEAKKKD